MRTILTLLFVLFLSASQAQEFKIKESSAQSIETTINIAGKDFKGGYSKTGSIYIVRISAKTGNEYKSYLGVRTDKDFILNGIERPIWTNKNQDKGGILKLIKKQDIQRKFILKRIKQQKTHLIKCTYKAFITFISLITSQNN